MIRQQRRAHSKIHTHGLRLMGATQGTVSAPAKDTTKKELKVAKHPLHKIIKYLRFTHDKLLVLSLICENVYLQCSHLFLDCRFCFDQCESTAHITRCVDRKYTKKV